MTIIMKYTFALDGEKYEALFTSYKEVTSFVMEVIEDGVNIMLVKKEFITIEGILADDDFEWPYKVEIIAAVVAPDHEFKKWIEAETYLKIIGVI